LVRDFYYENFWNAKAKGNSIVNQDIATFVFDVVVNHGQGVKNVVQRGINNAITAGKVTGNKIAEDNVMGNQTLSYLNNYGSTIYPYMLKAREAYYRVLATQGGNSAFLKGWLNRLATFPLSVAESIATAWNETDKKKG